MFTPEFALWSSFALGIAVGAISMLVLRKRGKSRYYEWGLLIGVSIVLIGITGFSIFAILAPDQSMSLILSEEESPKIRAVFPQGTWLWSWDERIQGAIIVSYSVIEEAVVSRLSPLTDNPKVRNLAYSVVVEASGTPENYLVYRESVGDKRLDDWVKFYLYEFNEQYSHKLAKFYNPLDEQQQNEFRSLLKGYLDPYLKGAGVRFVRAGFRIE